MVPILREFRGTFSGMRWQSCKCGQSCNRTNKIMIWNKIQRLTFLCCQSNLLTKRSANYLVVMVVSYFQGLRLLWWINVKTGNKWDIKRLKSNFSIKLKMRINNTWQELRAMVQITLEMWAYKINQGYNSKYCSLG